MEQGEVLSISGEDFVATQFFNRLMISQIKDGKMNTMTISNVDDCNLLIEALERVKADGLEILQGLEEDAE